MDDLGMLELSINWRYGKYKRGLESSPSPSFPTFSCSIMRFAVLGVHFFEVSHGTASSDCSTCYQGLVAMSVLTPIVPFSKV